MKPEEINPDTGRAYGDHGTANQALEYAFEEEVGEIETFLRCWREGDLEEWPEFYDWLGEQEWLETQA